MMKKLKAFTLIELIIVMAILVILMAAIMRMFVPIRETYVDTTLYENQRTVQNGIITYITESVRYSTDLGVYNDGISSAEDAVEAFATAYCTAYEITDTTEIDNVTDLLKLKADFIVIDNDPTTYGGKNCCGRLIRRKLVDGDDTISDDYKTSPNFSRLALGAAYYDDNTYSIGIDKDAMESGQIVVTVASTANHGGRNLSNSASRDIEQNINEGNHVDIGDQDDFDLIYQTGSVICRNLTTATSGTINIGVTTAGMCDSDSYTGSSTTLYEDTYIVFVDYDLKTELETLY